MSTQPVPPEAPIPSIDSKPRVPTSLGMWEKDAKHHQLESITLQSLEKVHSASELTALNFMAMRAVWPKTKAIDRFPPYTRVPLIESVGGKPPRDFSTIAHEVVREFGELQAYLEHVGEPIGNDVFREMGAFLLVRGAQSRVSRKPVLKELLLESDSVNMEPSQEPQAEACDLSQPGISREPSEASSASADAQQRTRSLSIITAAASSEIKIQPTKDEQIVNDALLLFLKALLVYQSDVRCQWESDRSPFDKAVFGPTSMTARTDGYLGANSEVFAIVEVKPNSRDRENRPQLLWQETGEMIAWLMHDDKHKRKCELRRRLLVSQDNHEIWLTIATPSDGYLEYLKSGRLYNLQPSNKRSRPSPPFLNMQTYGPWSIESASNMEDLAKIILAVAFEVTDDIANSAASQ